jgi:2-polyprenyl-6-methoxyphenol hydroxylase-like FAD-dependent oxidoreductase
MEIDMLRSETDVLIIGAGPTGLALATSLQAAGVDHLLIDALPEGQTTSRAAVVHAHTLEALAPLGVTEPLLERGLTLSRFTIRDRDRALLGIGFDDLPSERQGLLMVPQSTTEEVLASRLTHLGGCLHRGVKALSLAPDGASVEVRVEAAGESERTIRARYVVGADGMHSLVREAAGIPFEGAAYGESFVLADVRMDWPFGQTEVSLFFSPAGVVVVAPLPDGSFRIVATVEEAPPHPNAELMQKLLDARGPTKARAQVQEVLWSSRFRVHHRLAQTYRKGPFLLMGDAAHVHSPAGGQGMNTGLVDATVLGRALAAVLRDGAPEATLDDYAALRRPAAEQVLALAGRLTSMATLRSPALRMLRNLVLRTANRSPRVQRKLAMALSGLGRRNLGRLPRRAQSWTTKGVKRSAPALSVLHIAGEVGGR